MFDEIINFLKNNSGIPILMLFLVVFYFMDRAESNIIENKI
jgi:hypothetical protein